MAAAEVRLLDDGRAPYRTTARDDGTFLFEAVNPGTYLALSGDGRSLRGGADVVVRADDVVGVRVTQLATPRVRGMVRPAGPARVWLAAPSERAAFVGAEVVTTDADGRFELLAAADGELRVVARGQGGGVGEAAITVGADDLDGVIVELAAGAVIAGHVRDARGNGVGGLTVVAIPVAASRLVVLGAGGLANHPQAATDAAGAFVLEGLVPARYELRALHDGRPLRSPTGEVVVGDVTAAPGRTDGVELRVAAPVGELRGVVVDGDGVAMPDAWVRVVPDLGALVRAFNEGRLTYEPPPGQPARSSSALSYDEASLADVSAAVLTDADGRFVLRGLRREPMELVAQARRGALRGRASATPDADVRVVVAGVGSVRGVVTLDGAPVPRADLVVAGPTTQRQTLDDAAGAFACEGLEPGSYTFTARTPEGVASATVTVPAAGQATVRLELRRFSRIIGQVRTATGAPPPAGTPVMVNLQLPNGSVTWGIEGPPPRTDETGRFEATVKVGTVIVFVQLGEDDVSSAPIEVAPAATVEVGLLTLDGSNPDADR